MSDVFECKEDGLMPEKFNVAGREGRLQCLSLIGWIDLGVDEYDGGRNGCTYRIKPEAECG